jgi:hypothetical protein
MTGSKWCLRLDSYRPAALLAILPLVLAGCSAKSGPPTGTVSGTVTYKGQAVPGGTLFFTPASGGAATPGPINPDGTFSFGGIPVGAMVVTVEIKQQADYRQTTDPAVPKGPPKPLKIPDKYKDPKKSPLTWDVQKGDQTKDLALTD